MSKKTYLNYFYKRTLFRCEEIISLVRDIGLILNKSSILPVLFHDECKAKSDKLINQSIHFEELCTMSQ